MSLQVVPCGNGRRTIRGIFSDNERPGGGRRNETDYKVCFRFLPFGELW